MNVTFRQLKVFEAVARNLSYTKAARELHLTQPAVSMQIRQLEENVGLPLFEQLGKKIYPTAAGDEMYRYSRAIAAQIDEASEVIESLRGLKSGRLAVAVASTANYFATQLLGEFCRRHTGVSINLDVTNRENLIKQVNDNARDVFIMGQPPADLEVESEAFMQNPLVVIAAPDHPLVKKKKIPFQLLQHETFVIREQGSGTRIAMQRFFDRHEVQLTTGMEMSSNEAIKQAVMADLGLGLVSLHTLELELTSGRIAILDVENFPIMRNWYVVRRKGKRLSPVASEFWDFVIAEAATIWPMPHAVK
jgi:DNA-binding transcriptional LysR family regulator